MRRWLLSGVFGSALVLGCGGPVPVPDGGMPLACLTPQSIALAPSTNASLLGAPTALVAWRDGTCLLSTTEPDPDFVIQVFDLTDTPLGGLLALVNESFVPETVSAGTVSTSSVYGFARDTDVTVTLSRGTERLTLTFRVEAARLVLLDMRRF